ncbi:MAG: sigma-70 family RNA polymerase sigma factor [Pedobacter sp.]|nr:MAG: sigma-70 family RNA polymerase sigma factor [Pedobacter sp.]
MKRYVKNVTAKAPEYEHPADRELSNIIKEIMLLLPEKCQQVFKMSRLEGYSNQEIANELSISKSTVENHLNKALNLFRKYLKRYDIGFLVLYLLGL